MKHIEEFLIKNGFIKVNESIIINHKANITIKENCYEIEYQNDYYSGVFYTDTHKIYELIGFLTYYNLMDKNYII